jgi:hypothetical protein
MMRLCIYRRIFAELSGDHITGWRVILRSAPLLIAGYYGVYMEFAWSLNGFTTALHHAKAVQTP